MPPARRRPGAAVIALLRAQAARVVRHSQKRIGRGVKVAGKSGRRVLASLRRMVADGSLPARARVDSTGPPQGLVSAGTWRRRLTYRVPGERQHCPVCSGRIVHLDPLPFTRRSDDYRVGFISGCRQCGLVFANPFPTAADLEAMYTPDGDWGTRRPDAPSTKRPPVAYLRELFRPLDGRFDVAAPPAGGRVLDIGCGNGELLDAFQDLGWETFGIEPAGVAAFRRHARMSEIPADGTFRVAVLHHVLEHVASPLELLQSVNGALDDGGVVAISVPRLDAAYLHGELKYCINGHAHVLSYTRDCLATLLALAGFSAVDVSRPLDAAMPKAYMRRRLQMLGVKTPGDRVRPPRPLAAARRALRRYHAAHGDPAWWRVLPVRARAALLNEERRTRATSGAAARAS